MAPRPTRSTSPQLSRRTLAQGLASLPLALAGCASEPKGQVDQPFHHTADGFRNPPGSPARGGGFGDWANFFYRRFGPDEDVPLPDGHVLTNGEVHAGLNGPNGADSLTWLGHASFLLRINGRTILTDPFLSDHASPLPPLGPKRFAPPGLRTNQLPPIDVVLLSHNHYDHLDLPTIEALAGKSKIQVVVPLGLAGYFTSRGYTEVHEIDWYDVIEVAGLEVTALPAIHFSKRTFFDSNRTLWTGYAIQGGGQRIYFAGDTAYGPIYQELGRKVAPFDLALLPIGAYEPRLLMQAAHTTPEEAVQIARELNARRLVGMHWGSIRLTEEPPFEPPQRFRQAAQAAEYTEESAWVLRIGETRLI